MPTSPWSIGAGGSTIETGVLASHLPDEDGGQDMIRSNALPIRSLLFIAMCVCLSASGCGDDDSPSHPAAPVPQLDANYDPGVNANVSAGIGPFERAVTFTVLRTGALHHVELLFDNYQDPGPLVVDIRHTSNGTPVQDDRDVVAVTAIAVPDTSSSVSWFTADFAGSGAHVAAGDVLAIACRSAGYWNWYGDSDNPNPDSSVYSRSAGSGWTLNTAFGADFGFRLYVIPE
jgi:hypothetical protein